MLKKEYELAKGSIPYAIEQDKMTLSKIYPDARFEGKYVLFIVFDLCWQYSYQDITGIIKIQTHEGKISMPNVKVRNIYPSGNIFTCCLKVSKLVCDMGVPLIFDSFEDLSNINRLECRWEIDAGDADAYFQVEYDVSFEWKYGNRIYVIKSSEVDVEYLRTNEAIKSIYQGKRKFEEYEKVLHIRNHPEDEKILSTVIRDKHGLMSKDEIKSIFCGNVSKEEYKEHPERKFSVDYFYAKERLIPAMASGMLI
ncbi:MAG: hypothetical protein PHE94_01840 [Eubacteriales bacterium]|nr:hypothetical protein [Eubacteriales bacterium]MDD4121621.1 hypothetical protein [Eubacteriales bacterium]